MATLVPVGVTTMELSAAAAAVTVSVALPKVVPELAEMVVVPAAMPVARPVLSSMVATEGVPDIQITEEVISIMLPSE